MKLVEQLGDLDPALAQKLEQAVDTVRQEFEEKLTSAVRETVAEETARFSAEQLAAEQTGAGPAEAAAAASDPLDAATELRLAALDIDVATSQAEVLEALSRGALRFASRVAIFVNRGGELHGWSASGFGDADATIKNSVLAGDQVAPEGADRSTGSIALDAEECRVVCEALDAELPAMGLLMPFVLGNQIVGTVYCDRVGDAPFSVPALQLLTYLAGQTLETLAVRKRSSTATLNLAGAPTGSAAGAAVAEPAEPEAPSEAESTVAAEPEAAEAAPEAAEPVEATEEPEAPPVSVSEILDQPSGTDTVEPPPVEVAEPEDSSAAVAEPEAAELGPLAEPATEPALDAPIEPSEPAEPAAEEPPPAPPAPDTPQAGASPGDPAEPPVALGDTSVAPPEDVEGPGWAFTAPAPAGDASSDSGNEEAQRLARLLVTEIKLYNEEAVEEGRRNANIYARLQEDIDRSRQIFEDRIEESTRSQEDHFKQALVKILAGGDPALLGI